MENPVIKPLSAQRKRPPGKIKTRGYKRLKIKPFSTRKANRYFFLFFLIMACLLYGNTVLNKYAVGDEQVTHNPVVSQGIKAIPIIFSTLNCNDNGTGITCDNLYQPITLLTFALESEFFGDRPGLSHAFNVLIYFFLSAFLFFLLKRILNRYNILFPFLITLLFMAHPVHTEVVANLRNRGDMLAFLCGTGSLWYLLSYSETRNFRYLTTVLVFFFIGLLCKSTTLVFILIFPVVLYFYTGMPLRKCIPIFFVMVIVAVIAKLIPILFIPGSIPEDTFTKNPLYFEKNLWIRLGTSFMVLLFYIKILIYPVSLVYHYGYDMIQIVSLANLWVIFSVLIHGTMFLFAVRKFRRKHLLSFAILWYLLAIFPYSNFIFPVNGIVAERYIFTASLGFCIASVYAVFLLFNTDPMTLTIEVDARIEILALFIIIMIPGTLLTISRNTKWKNTETIFSADIEDLHNSTDANAQYGAFLLKSFTTGTSGRETLQTREEKQQAVVLCLKQSLKIYPGNREAIKDLARAYLLFGVKPDPGDPLTTIDFWERTAAKYPSPEAYLLLKWLFTLKNDLVKADYYDKLSLMEKEKVQ